MKHSLFLRLHKNFGAFALLFVCFTLVCLPGASGQTFSGTGTRSVIGSQTTALGATYYGNAAPNVTPSAANWRTVVRFHVDTSAQVQWAFLGSTWKAQGVIRRVTPPPATATNGSATLDYRYAQWQADGDSTRYTYDFQEGCWSPLGVYRHDTIPTNVAAGVGTGSVCYEFSPWLNTDNDSLYLYQDGTWLSVGTGSGSTGSGVDNFYRDGDTLRLVAGVDTFSVSAVEPDSAVYATLTTLADSMSIVRDSIDALRADIGTGGGGGISGSGTSPQLAYFSGSTALTSSAAMQYSTGGGLALKNTNQATSSTFVVTQTFSADTTNWTRGTGWTFNGTTAVATAASGALTYSPTVTITSGNAYLVTVTQGAYTAGTVTIALGNASIALPQYTVTNYAVLLRPTSSTGGFRFTTSTYTGTLDNVSITQITPASTLASFQLSSSSTSLLPTYVPNSTSYALGGGGQYTTGINNVFQGGEAGNNAITTASAIAQGYQAGASNTTGANWLAQGFQAGFSNTIGSTFVAQGYRAGYLNTTGSNWIAQGDRAGNSNTTGSSWIAQGAQAGFSNTIGSTWIAQGFQAGYSNTIRSSWIAQGNLAGYSNITGSNWIAKGNQAGYSNSSGSNWVAIGNESGYSNTSGSNWVTLGNQAGLFWAGGTVGANFTNSVYIGSGTRVSGSSGTRDNENVFGDRAIGSGDNTVTLGNSSIVMHYLSGTGGVDIPVGTTAQRPTGMSGVLRGNSTTLRPDYHNGTAWRQLLDLPDATPTTNHIPIWSGTAWTTGTVPTGSGGIYGGNGNIANNTAATLVANGFFRFVGANGTEVISMKDGTTAGLGSVALYSTRLAYIYGGDSTALWGGAVQVKNPTYSLAGNLDLYEARNNGTNRFRLRAPANLSNDLDFILPSADGTSGQALTTNGSGTLSWSTVSSSNIGNSNLTLTSNRTLTQAGYSFSAFGGNFHWGKALSTPYTGPAYEFTIRNYNSASTNVTIQSGRDSLVGGTATLTFLSSGTFQSAISFGTALSQNFDFYNAHEGRNILKLGSGAGLGGNGNTIIFGGTDDPIQWGYNAKVVVYDTISTGKALLVVKKENSNSIPIAVFGSESNDRVTIHGDGVVRNHVYGTSATTASSLGKTESIYAARHATDGTLLGKATQNGLASTTTDASGDITVTFATAMPDATYTVNAQSENLVGNATDAVHSKTGSSFKIRTYHGGSAVGAGTSVTYSWSATDY